MSKIYLKDYKPTFIKCRAGQAPILENYERKWFCNTNKIIHQTEKEVINCIDCVTKYEQAKK